jgi:hypothetical protein
MKALISSIVGGTRWRRPPDMRRTRHNPWLAIGFDAWSLGVAASTVVGLRAIRIAQGGPAGRAEAQRMVHEKVEAAAALQRRLLEGGLGDTPASASARSIAHYRRKVNANRRRLSKR